MHHNYDARLKQKRREKKIRLRLMAEAERARFEAKHQGTPPKLYVSFGFSDLDPTTNIAFTWDLWVKFPFKVPKAKCEEFKKEMQRSFEQIFLT